MRFKLLMFWNESNGVEQSSLPLLPKPHKNRPKSAQIPARRFGERRKLKSREFGTAANLELVNLRLLSKNCIATTTVYKHSNLVLN